MSARRLATISGSRGRPMIDALATEPHFFDHLVPVWRALPESLRGTFYVAGELMLRASRAKIKISPLPRFGPAETPTVVASYGDYSRAHRMQRPVIMLEHGAGQSYHGDPSSRGHRSYAGAERKGVIRYIVPGPAAAAAYEGSGVHVSQVGCPKLDNWLGYDPQNDRPVIAISFHWQARVCQEATSALPYYRHAFAELSRHYRIIGHSHPRIANLARISYAAANIPYYNEFEDVLAEADVYCCDNSSTMFEFAALGRPVVVLNSPRYRRRVSHGLRFWDAADMGPNVWAGTQAEGDLAERWRLAIDDALNSPGWGERRTAAALLAYSHIDNGAAERAAHAIEEAICQLQPTHSNAATADSSPTRSLATRS